MWTPGNGHESTSVRFRSKYGLESTFRYSGKFPGTFHMIATKRRLLHPQLICLRCRVKEAAIFIHSFQLNSLFEFLASALRGQKPPNQSIALLQATL